ncbi:hypothetical protein NE237_033097 [Protea cynaroides]|uniref:Uncharacterized protein n=1 Tax=Protea cynaroides TaxID=273540 RepID=A0A9Q0R4C8_9MAGN|nr:hypothetical protein NE237_033097 [Protea cynaroides]
MASHMADTIHGAKASSREAAESRSETGGLLSAMVFAAVISSVAAGGLRKDRGSDDGLRSKFSVTLVVMLDLTQGLLIVFDEGPLSEGPSKGDREPIKESSATAVSASSVGIPARDADLASTGLVAGNDGGDHDEEASSLTCETAVQVGLLLMVGAELPVTDPIAGHTTEREVRRSGATVPVVQFLAGGTDAAMEKRYPVSHVMGSGDWCLQPCMWISHVETTTQGTGARGIEGCSVEIMHLALLHVVIVLQGAAVNSSEDPSQHVMEAQSDEDFSSREAVEHQGDPNLNRVSGGDS